MEETKSAGSSRLKLTGLWRNKTKNGDAEYISGNLTASTGIQIWPNKFKQTDKDPDFIMYIVQREVKRREEFNLEIAVNKPDTNQSGFVSPSDIPF